MGKDGEANVGLNLVLLGKTGAGKSASGNTILGREAFKSMKRSTSVTRELAVESGAVGPCRVTVYDTPGLFGTGISEHEIQQIYQSVFQKCESGPCVFLLVIKADRFTPEERETVEKIEELLGQNRLKKTWILFTRGDELEEEKMTIKEFLNDTVPLKNLIQKYDGRYHVFNNKTKGRIDQVKMLLKKVVRIGYKIGEKILRRNPVDRPKTCIKKDVLNSVPDRRIVLLGKSGAGKSATGNTILGQKMFKSKHKMISVTHKCSEKRVNVSGRNVSVVDTPGFFDTSKDLEDLVTEIARSVYVSSPGPHAFLIVLRADERFTEQEEQIPQIIEMLFGEEVLKYSIILFTHGDLLKRQNIDKLIEENSQLRSVVDQCGGGYHVFNNRNKGNRDQVTELLQKIDTMIQQNGGGHYTNQMYEDAQRFKQEEEEERLREEEERQRVEEERKQQMERQRQEEIENLRAKLEAQRSELENIKEQRRREEERIQQEEKQIQNETEELKEANKIANKIANKTANKTVDEEKIKDEPDKGLKNFIKRYWSRFIVSIFVLGLVCFELGWKYVVPIFSAAK